MEDAPGRAKPEVKSTFCHSRVGAAAADQHLEGNGFRNQIATFGRYQKGALFKRLKGTALHIVSRWFQSETNLASQRCEKGRWRLAADQEPVDLLEEEKLLR